MKVSLVVFAATLALLAAASSVHGVSSVSPWQAFWTDSRHGGMIATCVEGTSFWGVYSNIGYLQGNISADGTTASGTWYESGHVDGATGGFVWTLNSNLNGFTGVRRTQYIRCAPAIWSETKITTSTPSRTDCLRVYDNTQVSLLYSTIEGTYTNGLNSALHICLTGDGLYEMSAFQGSILTYGTGYARGTGNVIGTGSYVDTSSTFSGTNHGIEMYLLADPFENNLGLGSNNGTVLYQIRYVGASSPSDITAATSQAVVVQWQRSSITPQSCSLQRVLYQQPWLGAWTDYEFGFGRLYVCQSLDGRLRGVFSELGWIEGQISPDGQNVTGRFYDAGDTHQVSGDFSWSLVDPSHFIGQWSFDNSGHQYLWNETRVSVVVPSASQCLYPDSSVVVGATTIAGTWRYDTSPTADTLDICFSSDSTRFEASYNFNGGTSRGYITGFVREFGTALQGEWHESGLQGILTIFLTSQNTIRMLRWNHGDIQASYYYNCDDENGDILWMRHRSVSFTQRISTSAKASSCARNADLISFVQAGPFVPVGFTDKYAVSYVAFHEPTKKRNVFDALLAMFGADNKAQNLVAADDDQSAASMLSSSSSLLVLTLSAVVALLCCTF